MSNYILIKSNKFEFKNGMKIAGFDFDFTLVKTKSGKKFPIDENDWEIWDSSVLSKLTELVKNGYSLVIFSNQNGVGSGKSCSKMVVQRFKNFIDYTKLNWICIAATQRDLLRKPNVGMWNLLFDNYKINMKESLYIGDAAGRIKNYVKGRNRDFSCSDRKFALNLKIDFYTPEEFFVKELKSTNFIIDGFNPLEYQIEQYQKISFKKNKKEMIIMVGSPASGKSKFSKKYYKNYAYINQDKLKSKAKCIKECKNKLIDDISIIIDNTNPNKDSRKIYIDLAKKYDYQIICYHMNINKELAKHLNYYRFKKSNGKKKLIPTVAYNIYFKKFEEPTLDEGFKEIIKINPNFNFKKNEDLQLFLEFN